MGPLVSGEFANGADGLLLILKWHGLTLAFNYSYDFYCSF